MATVGDWCEAHLLVEGLVDPPRETARLQEQLGKLRAELDDCVKRTQVENYEEKVHMYMSDSCDFCM